MREILFRGKRTDNGKFVEGFLFVRKDTKGETIDHFIILDAYEQITFGQRYVRSNLNQECFRVQLETAGQFTGKTDKNGKKVFEHDILQIFTVWADGTKEKAGIGVVQWRENDQCYVLTTKEGYHIDDFGNYGRPEYYEVIGNIHDNPELLEE